MTGLKIIRNPSEGETTGVDFRYCIDYLNKHGRQDFGMHFAVSEADYDTIYRLLVYFGGHEESAEQEHICLQKGLLLCGPIGCGKTSLMALLRTFVMRTEHKYIVKACRDISIDFAQDGFDVIDRYGRLAYKTGDPERIALTTWERSIRLNTLVMSVT